MRLKPGVKTEGVKPEALVALQVVARVFSENPRYGELVVTSITDDAPGRVPGSLHPKGFAFDIRTRDLTDTLRRELAQTIALRLGADYDVVLEADHIHVEYDPS
ncbi:MAG TPA: hypothetical protein VEA38_11640 [Terriglobales bacterium]|nr:hypothetical protein [Terriglobales bacterium]